MTTAETTELKRLVLSELNQALENGFTFSNDSARAVAVDLTEYCPDLECVEVGMILPYVDEWLRSIR